MRFETRKVKVTTVVPVEVKLQHGCMMGYLYDAAAAPAPQNEALPLWPGEAITRPLLALLRSGAANKMVLYRNPRGRDH